MAGSWTPLTRDVQGVNINHRLVSADDGALGDIEYFLDLDGEATDDPEDACVAMVKWRDCELWSAVNLSAFEMHRKTH